jgi:hypothetical protein
VLPPYIPGHCLPECSWCSDQPVPSKGRMYEEPI